MAKAGQLFSQKSYSVFLSFLSVLVVVIPMRLLWQGPFVLTEFFTWKALFILEIILIPILWFAASILLVLFQKKLFVKTIWVLVSLFCAMLVKGIIGSVMGPIFIAALVVQIVAVKRMDSDKMPFLSVLNVAFFVANLFVISYVEIVA